MISTPLAVVKDHHLHTVGGYLIFTSFVVLDNVCMKILGCFITRALSPEIGH